MMSSTYLKFRNTFEELRGEGRGWILVVIAAGWFLSIGVRLVYPALLPYLRTTFGMELSTAGALLTVLWLAYAIGQFPGGILGDRLGGGKVLLLSTAVTGLTVFVLTISGSVFVFFAMTLVFGLSTAIYGPSRFTIISNIYDERDGMAIGVTMAAGNLGNTLLPAIAGTFAATVSWRLGFGFSVPLFALVGLGIWYFIPNRISQNTNVVGKLTPTALRHIFSNLANRSILTITLIQLLAAFSYQGFTGFYPTYLVEVKGLSSMAAAILFGLFFAMGIVLQPLTGMMYDRFGIRRSLPLIFLISVCSITALPFVESTYGIVAVTITASALLGYGPVTLTYLTDLIPQDIKGSGLGLIRTGYMMIAASGPAVVGTMGEMGLFTEAFLALGGLLLLATLLCAVITPGR